MIADGLHSLSDLISDGVVLIAAKYSTLDADTNHPYGHARFETLATVAIGGLLFIVAIAMLIDAARRLFDPTLLLQPTTISLVIAMLSIVIKEALYQYTTYIAKRVRSQMLRANAWHHRSDAISSVIVFLGIVGSMAGVSWLDAVAAIGVSMMIAHIGFQLGISGVSELVDTGLNSQQLSDITEIIVSVDGVKTLHELRTRRMGANALVDVHILVNPCLSVSEGHHIGERVRIRLIEEMDEVADVLVHIDPENDESEKPNLQLPLRDEIVAGLRQRWQSLQATDTIEKITLHYLGVDLRWIFIYP
ncbi:Cation efflux protein [Beggiatoa sp. PS]|nr:Cation efflux protein [Beggiatoa sp. PS]